MGEGLIPESSKSASVRASSSTSCILDVCLLLADVGDLGHYGGFDLLLTTSLRTDFILARVLN
jgi:hypothetical protein